MNQDLVSVIVPVYNTEKWLPHCLESISGQTWRDLEIILVDDGSTDGSGRICDDFAEKDCRCRVIHQENRGLWAARNTGLDAARGAFIFLPDSDDYFHHDMVRILLEAIRSENGYELAFSGVQMTWSPEEDTSGPVDIRISPIASENPVKDLFDYRKSLLYAVVWNKLYRKETIADLRFRDLPRSQDLDFNLRLLMRSPSIVQVYNPLYYWIQRTDSITHLKGTAEVAYRCTVKLLSDKLSDPSTGEETHRPILLSQLYKKMSLWKGCAWKTDRYEEVRKLSRSYDAISRKDYLACRRIGVAEKALVLSLLGLPALTHGLMRLTNNL